MNQIKIEQLRAVLVQAIESSGFSVSGPTDSRAAEHGEPAWVCNAREVLADTAAKKPKLNEIAQVVVFTSGGVTRSVAIRDLPKGDVPCIVVDYDDRQDDAGDISPEAFERKKLGISREEFDQQATYVW